MSFLDEVQSNVRELLGRDVKVSQKALDALWFSSTRQNRPVSNLLASIVKASPAIGDILLRSDFDPALLGQRVTAHRPEVATLRSVLLQTLTDPGCHRSTRQKGELTTATQHAVSSGRLTEVDLFASMVEVATLSHWTAASTMLEWTYYPPEESDREWVKQELDGLSKERRQVKFWMADELAKKLPGEIARISLLDPDVSDWQFAFWWDGRQARISAIDTFGAHNIQQQGAKSSPAFSARGNLVNPQGEDSSGITASGISELEWLMNSNANESAFQEFFNKHPQFLLGMEYKSLHSQLILQHVGEEKLIPDYFLEYLDGGFVDVLDLKRPSAILAKFPKNRVGMTAAFHEAVNQLRTYRNWFDDPTNRKTFRQRHPGLDAYRPRMIVVMGRTAHFQSKELRQKVLEAIPDFTRLWTYDDVVNRARRFLEFSRKA